MKIRVDVESAILGNSTFWEGDSEDIEEIRNLPARITAKEVVKDGKKRKLGMWVVYVVE